MVPYLEELTDFAWLWAHERSLKVLKGPYMVPGITAGSVTYKITTLTPVLALPPSSHHSKLPFQATIILLQSLRAVYPLSVVVILFLELETTRPSMGHKPKVVQEKGTESNPGRKLLSGCDQKELVAPVSLGRFLHWTPHDTLFFSSFIIPSSLLLTHFSPTDQNHSVLSLQPQILTT